MNSKIWLYGLLTVVVLVCGCSEGTKQAKEGNIMMSDTYLVELKTSMGNIALELNPKAAPVTVKNFLGYVESGFYDGTTFHRVIPGFMIQGGGLTADMEEKQKGKPIINEANNGLGNIRGSIAMARGPEPDSATSEFFINQVNNKPLDYIPNRKPGYAVFGKVIEGMDTVDAIISVKTTTRKDKQGKIRENVPVKPIVIKSARVVSK